MKSYNGFGRNYFPHLVDTEGILSQVFFLCSAQKLDSFQVGMFANLLLL